MGKQQTRGVTCAKCGMDDANCIVVDDQLTCPGCVTDGIGARESELATLRAENERLTWEVEMQKAKRLLSIYRTVYWRERSNIAEAELDIANAEVARLAREVGQVHALVWGTAKGHTALETVSEIQRLREALMSESAAVSRLTRERDEAREEAVAILESAARGTPPAPGTVIIHEPRTPTREEAGDE